MKDVEAALLDFVDIFKDLAIPYAIIGGVAVRAYGVPRPTYDVDVTISVSEAELPTLYESVEEKGYTIPDAYRAGWVDRIAGMPLVKFRIYRPDKSVDVDIFIAETAYQRVIVDRRRPWKMDERRVWIASPEDLVLLKLLAGRHRDYGDIEDLRMLLGDLDEPYLRQWAEELGVSSALEEVLRQPPL